jgi:hypothetical protein
MRAEWAYRKVEWTTEQTGNKPTSTWIYKKAD